MISVLFVRPDSVYKTLNVDCWDIHRDATKFCGDHPVICHPPCRAWGKLKGFAKPREGEKGLALMAIDLIRKNGGCLEHPAQSSISKFLPKPGQLDEFGGFTIHIDQFWFGHRAKKQTLLYICGIEKRLLPAIPIRFDAITHRVGFPKSWGGRSKYGIKEVTKKEREATPPDLAKWLIQVATLCLNQNSK